MILTNPASIKGFRGRFWGCNAYGASAPWRASALASSAVHYLDQPAAFLRHRRTRARYHCSLAGSAQWKLTALNSWDGGENARNNPLVTKALRQLHQVRRVIGAIAIPRSGISRSGSPVKFYLLVVRKTVRWRGVGKAKARALDMTTSTFGLEVFDATPAGTVLLSALYGLAGGHLLTSRIAAAEHCSSARRRGDSLQNTVAFAPVGLGRRGHFAFPLGKQWSGGRLSRVCAVEDSQGYATLLLNDSSGCETHVLHWWRPEHRRASMRGNSNSPRAGNLVAPAVMRLEAD